MNRTDFLVTAAFFLIAVGYSFLLSSYIPAAVYEYGGDVWLEADLQRIYKIMTNRFVAIPRTSHHPIFPLVMYPPTRILVKVGVDPVLAIRIVCAIFCGLWAATLFSMLRAMKLLRLDAAVLTLLALSTASVMFFFAVPETFLLGSITIMVALCWAFRDPDGKSSAIIEAFLGAATLGMTVTNGMAVAVIAFFRRSFGDAVQVLANSLLIVVLLWTAQKFLVPASEFFLGNTYRGEFSGHVFSVESGGPMMVAKSFFLHTAVMPELDAVSRPSAGRWLILLTQLSPVSLSVALILWLLLLAAGAYGVATLRSKTAQILVILIAGQFALHIVFGNETFLYSLHWLPLLIGCIALATQTRLRVPVLASALLFTVAGGFANASRFGQATEYLTTVAPMIEKKRAVELREIRKDEPWPGTQIPIMADGFRYFDLAAYEEGGGLWPALDTFNIAFWAGDKTSHELNGHVETDNHGGQIRIHAETTSYRAKWRADGPRNWKLVLTVPVDQEAVYVVIRGIGWNNSAIYDVRQEDDGTVLINTRWQVISDAPVEIGNPQNLAGWGYVRIGPFHPGEHALSVVDVRREGSTDSKIDSLSRLLGSLRVAGDQ